MPTVLGSYPITVAGNVGWVPGPIFRAGDSIRIQALGAILWSNSGGGAIVSSPATFNTPGAGGTTPVTIAVPAGTFASATWRLQGTRTLGIVTQAITGVSNSQTLGSFSGSGSFDTGQVAASASQLVDINAAAGGNLAVKVGSGGNAASITAFALTLSGSSLYALPEGGYPTTYPNSHSLDPGSVLQNAGWTGSALVVSNVVPICLAAIVLPDGVTPALTPGYSGLRPNQDTTYSASDLATAGASDVDTTYRLWLVFNDGYQDFADNTGSYSVTVTRYAGVSTMPPPIKSLERPQFGVDSTYGTQTTASRMLCNLLNSGFEIDPVQQKTRSGIAGIAFDTRQLLVNEMAKGSAKVQLEYRDVGYILASIYGAPVIVNLTSGVYQHTYEDNGFAAITPQSYWLEVAGATGDRAQSAAGLIFTTLKVDTERDKEPSASADMIAKALTDNASPSTGANDVQTVTVNGGPTGGTFILAADNAQTATIAYNATTSAVQTALRALGGGWAACVVSGSAGSYIVTGSTGLPLPLLVAIYVNGSGANTLTGGTTPTVTTAHTTVGGMAMHTVDSVLAGQLSVSFATDLTTIENAPTVLTNEFKTAIEIGERIMAGWRQNATDVGIGFLVQKKADEIVDKVSLCMQYDSACSTFIANSKSGTNMVVRIRWTGPAIGVSAYNLTETFDVHGNVEWSKNEDSQGNVRSVDFDITPLYSSSLGFRSRWTLINDVSSYAS